MDAYPTFWDRGTDDLGLVDGCSAAVRTKQRRGEAQSVAGGLKGVV